MNDYLKIFLILLYRIDHILSDPDDFMFEYLNPQECSRSELFIPHNFTCKKCPNNLISSENREC